MSPNGSYLLGRLRLTLVIGLTVFLCLGGMVGGAGAQEEDYRSLCQELAEAGFTILGSGVAYGVPYARIEIPMGASITSLCRRVPNFNADFTRCRNKIAFLNALNPSYIKTRDHQPYSLEAETLKIPLNWEIVPEIFPAHDNSLESYPKFILVDVGKGFLALYGQGELLRVFPISGGAPERATPLTSFTIKAKYENHWSTIYDTWMPWSLLIQSPYYIHGGALPGRRDSAGCIRLFPGDAQELYHLVAVGTPGRIVQTAKLDQVYPAFFCR
jgi:hypothetical protein